MTSNYNNKNNDNSNNNNNNLNSNHKNNNSNNNSNYRNNNYWNKTQSTKGQVEIVGLLIIVLIISLMLLFAVKVVFFKEDTNELTDFRNQEIVSSFTGALLRTSATGCSSDQIRNLLISIGKNSNYVCPNSGISGKEYLQQVLPNYFANTLDEWNMAYDFRVIKKSGGVNEEIVSFDNSEVVPFSPLGGDAEPFLLPLYPVQGNIEIWLCLRSECVLP